MKLVKVQKNFFEKCKNLGADPYNQLLHNEAGRPCVLIMKLIYKGKYRDFVVPMKSNISPKTDKATFFALPPNKRTRAGNYHGIYYIKLFPINRIYIQPYLISEDKYMQNIQKIFDKPENKKEIIGYCQNYLTQYEAGNKNYYTPDIDLIIDKVL